VDAGGVRIFRYLKENLFLGPRPHQMTKEMAEKSGQPADADPTLASIADWTARSANWWSGWHLDRMCATQSRKRWIG